MDYNRYDFNDDNLFIPHKCCGDIDIDTSISDEDMSKIQNVIDDALDEALKGIKSQITTENNEIIQEIHDHAIPKCKFENLATKCDVQHAANHIIQHTESAFESIDFDGKFSDLNEQIASLREEFKNKE